MFGLELLLEFKIGQLSLECSADLQNAHACLKVHSLEQVSPRLKTKHVILWEERTVVSVQRNQRTCKNKSVLL